jgi:hypothetical protein
MQEKIFSKFDQYWIEKLLKFWIFRWCNFQLFHSLLSVKFIQHRAGGRRVQRVNFSQAPREKGHQISDFNRNSPTIWTSSAGPDPTQNRSIVCPSKIGVCVWVQILKRLVVRFFWNFYTIIWHLFTFSFANWKIFPVTSGFSGAVLRKNESPF